MICCNKCGTVIIEPKEEPKEDEAEKSRYKKTAPKEEAPARRPSLVSMPTSRIVNGFAFEDVDLCDVCKAMLYKQVNEVKFEFMKNEDDGI